MAEGQDRRQAREQQRQVRAELLAIGGDELLKCASAEADWYADLFFPWEEGGDEPIDRIYARLSILTQRLHRARREASGDR